MANNHHSQHSQQRLRADYRIPAIEKYAYCLCLHVKPTTIFIAVFKLIRALLFASILLNTEFSVSEHGDLSLSIDERHKSTAAAVNILARIIMASVSAVGIYAVISGRAALLMPLYAILLVDFFFSLPALYNRESDSTFGEGLAGDLRGYSSPTQGNNQYARYSIMLFSTLLMIIKIYFLCVIWKCYRYLRLIELVSPIIYPPYQGGPCPIRILGRPEQDLTDAGTGNNIAPPPYESIASSMKPPNYEEAMKTSNMGPLNNPVLGQQQQQQTVVIASLNSDQQSQQQQQEQQFSQNIPSNSIAIPMTGNTVALSNEPAMGSSNVVNNQIATSTIQGSQNITGPAAHDSVVNGLTIDNSPNIVVVNQVVVSPNGPRDMH